MIWKLEDFGVLAVTFYIAVDVMCLGAAIFADWMERMWEVAFGE